MEGNEQGQAGQLYRVYSIHAEIKPIDASLLEAAVN